MLCSLLMIAVYGVSQVGKVVEVECQAGSDKLYKCQVDLGGEDKR